jgi:hypothetical protein
MAVPNAFPLGLPVTDRPSPTSDITEVCATAGLDQHLGLLSQGDAAK